MTDNSDHTVLVIGGKFRDGCVTALGDDGVPVAFWRPEGEMGANAMFFEIAYGPTPSSCFVWWTNESTQMPEVHCLDMEAGSFNRVQIPLPELDGQVVRLNLLSTDGANADVLVERSGKSYARSFLLRVRDGNVTSKKNIPIRGAFTAHHRISVKKPKGELPRVEVVTEETGLTRELVIARSSKSRLGINSLSPDHSLLLVEEVEWQSSQERSRQTQLTLFDLELGERLGSTGFSGGEAFVSWMGPSHLCVAVSDTTDVLAVPDLRRIGRTSDRLFFGGAVRDGRIWRLDEAARSVMSAPLEGGPSTVHHQFGSGEQPGMPFHHVLALKTSRSLGAKA